MTALISAQDLLALIPDRPGRPIVFDCQFVLGAAPGAGGRDRYVRAHLPGAHFLDVDTDLAGPPGPQGRHPLPDLNVLKKTLRGFGVHDASEIVVYDEGSGMGSARAWWLLGYAGLSRVRVLDGGLPAWQAAGGQVTDAVPQAPGTGTVTLRAGGLPTLDEAQAARVAEHGILLDARAPERFAGVQEPIDPVAGHIPGAANLPISRITGEDGRLVDREQLHARFAEAGVFDRDEVGVYCGSGITAARLALALREVAVTPSLYVGSWSAWISDPERPVATGPQ